MDTGATYVSAEITHMGEQEGLIASQKEGTVLPLYDKSKATERLVLVGLGLVWTSGIACIAGASVILARPSYFSVNSQTLQLPAGLTSANNSAGVYAFIVTVLITLCTESTGFIHDVSLRWNLFEERRLNWTSSLRLLTTSKVTLATGSLSNVLYFFTLAVAYTASSQLFVVTAFSTGRTVGNNPPDNAPYGSTWNGTGTLASGAALMTLGSCLIGQAALVSWIYCASRRRIKTWSSNSLTIMLACVSADGGLAGASKFPKKSSLLSTAARLSSKLNRPSEYQLESPLSNATPRKKQESLASTRKAAARWAFAILSVLPILVLVWAGIVLHAWKKNGVSISWAELSSDTTKISRIASGDNWAWAPAIQPFEWQQGGWSEAPPMSPSTVSFIILIIVCCVQAYLTFALHCAEVLVNSARDQATWEKAANHLRSEAGGSPLGQNVIATFLSYHLRSKSTGAPLNQNVVTSFLSNPPNVFLLASKSVAHWLFNRSLLPCIFLATSTNSAPVGKGWQVSQTQIFLFGVPVLILAVVLLLLLTLTLYLVCRRPKGPQPSTFGHVQTLAEVIDDWGDGAELFWGDKGLTEGGVYRRAGTAGTASGVGPIYFETEYI